jgi:ABC-type transport system involved in multi-copper enzyme maturation permease subunit
LTAAIENTLISSWIGAAAFIVVGATFFGAGNRRDQPAVADNPSSAAPLPQGAGEKSEGAGLPAGERVLAAKAIVIGAVTFVVGLTAVATAVVLGERMLRAGGNELLPVKLPTELRVIVGTAAVLGLTAVLALALGALFRRRWAAIAVAITVMVLPLIVAVALVLPGVESHWEPRLATSQWLLRLTPAAGFAIRQSIPEYPHVLGPYTAMMGYYPLSPWAGFSVLCGYTAFALGLAAFLLRRKHKQPSY